MNGSCLWKDKNPVFRITTCYTVGGKFCVSDQRGFVVKMQQNLSTQILFSIHELGAHELPMFPLSIWKTQWNISLWGWLAVLSLWDWIKPFSLSWTQHWCLNKCALPVTLELLLGCFSIFFILLSSISFLRSLGRCSEHSQGAGALQTPEPRWKHFLKCYCLWGEELSWFEIITLQNYSWLPPKLFRNLILVLEITIYR